MPQSPPRNAQFQWAELTDFSPGIFSNDNLAGGTNVAADVTSTNLAMAQVTDTWGCRALPSGGLGPLPLRKYAFPVTTPPDAGTGLTYTINGMNTWGFVLNDGSGGNPTDSNHRVEVHLLVTYPQDVGSGNWDNNVAWLRERIYETPVSTDVLHSNTDPARPTAIDFNYAYFLKTRMNPATPDDVGTPVMVCIWTDDSLRIHVNKAFPDPASAGTNSTVDVGVSLASYRRAVAHQGRIVMGLFLSYNHGANTNLNTDENIVWTATNDNTLDVQSDGVTPMDPASFVPEVDQAINDWSSMSANQLLVVKRIGGGYVLQGDLADTTVVRLPNLKSPDGTATVKGCNTPIGFVYSAGDNGLYLWNGGDGAVPISDQLDGKTFTDIPGIDRRGLVGQCDRWGDLLLAPNGWVCDLDGKSWWRIESPDQDDPLDHPIIYWSQTSYEGQAVGVTRNFTDGEDCIFVYELDTLAYTYSWRSQSLWASQDRYIETREAIIAIEGLGQVTISAIDESGNESAHTFTNTNATGVHNFRSNLACTAENLQIKLVSTGVASGTLGEDIAAPLIHRCYVGFVQKQHLALDV